MKINSSDTMAVLLQTVQYVDVLKMTLSTGGKVSKIGDLQ